MVFSAAGLEYSRPGQTWYKNIYTDKGVSDSPMQYLHVDEGEWCPKAIIYVSSVTENSGPTHFIPESNRWRRSEFLFRSHKGLDRILTDRYHSVWSGDFYRIVFRDDNLRRIFMELPPAFQGSSHFGDDILADTSLAEELARREIKFLGGDAEAIIFDGSRSLHRGSLVKEGERLALQIIFRNANDERVKAVIENGYGLKNRLTRVAKLAMKALRS
jgi:hypothetical protein